MLTNPNTLGLFDRNIEEIATIVHDVGGDALLRRREPERGDGHLAARRHGLRHRPLQPAQDVHAAARRRRPGLGPDRGVRPHRAVPAAPAGRRGRERSNGSRGRASTSTTTGPSRSAACAASRATSACSCARTPTSARWAATGLKEASETAVLNANYLKALLGRRRRSPSTCRSPSTATACTSSCCRAAARRRSSASRRSTSPSGCSTTRCTRRRSTSRCSWTRR